MMAETIMVILGRERSKGDKSNSSVTPFPIKYQPICQQDWRYQPNKPSATASKRRWNGDATCEHMGRSGGERDILRNKTKPKTKTTHVDSKRHVWIHFHVTLQFSIHPRKNQPPPTAKHVTSSTSEHQGTWRHPLLPFDSQCIQPSHLADKVTNHRQPELLWVDLLPDWRQRIFFFN